MANSAGNTFFLFFHGGEISPEFIDGHMTVSAAQPLGMGGMRE